MRANAEAALDADEAFAKFNQRQTEARSILEQMKTPLDRVNEDIEQAIGLLRAGALSVDQFNQRMDFLAERLADARHELDEGAKAWEGFGRDVAQNLADVALNGGSALDILQQLIRLPLERLLQANFVNPVGDWIDGLTGNNRDKNVAAARAGMPDAGRMLGAHPEVLDAATSQAASSVSQMALQTELASRALMQFIASLQAGSSLGGGGGGVASGISGLASLFGAGLGGGSGGIASGIGGLASLFGGGAASGAAGAGAGLAAALGGFPGFAGGTDSVPVGRDFWVGENGKERMRLHAGGRLEVVNGPRSHRAANDGGGATIINQTVNVPERVDPRRTASGIARSTQGALMRAGRKGLAGTRN